MIKSWLTRIMLGKKGPNLPLEDTPQWPEVPFGIDSFYFFGTSPDGSGGVFRMAFRPEQQIETWCALHLPGLGTYRVAVEQGRAFPHQFRMKSLPNHHFELTANDVMETPEGKTVQVTLQLTYVPEGPIFDFSTLKDHAHLHLVISKAQWSKRFFKDLASLSSQHIEQKGRLKGFITLDGQQIPIDWVGVRDHSRGFRSWDKWQNHSWFTGVSASGKVFNASVIAFEGLPVLRAGYFFDGKEAVAISGAPQLPVSSASGEIELAWQSIKGVLTYKTQHIWPFIMDSTYPIQEGMGTFEFQGETYLGILERGGVQS
jgi:hypothetical protein